MVFPKDKLSVIVTSYIKKDGLELRSQEKFLQRKFPKKYSIWIIRFRTFCRNLSMTDDKNRLQNCKMLGLDHITRLNSTQLNSTGQFSDHSQPHVICWVGHCDHGFKDSTECKWNKKVCKVANKRLTAIAKHNGEPLHIFSVEHLDCLYCS